MKSAKDDLEKLSKEIIVTKAQKHQVAEQCRLQIVELEAIKDKLEKKLCSKCENRKYENKEVQAAELDLVQLQDEVFQ